MKRVQAAVGFDELPTTAPIVVPGQQPEPQGRQPHAEPSIGRQIVTIAADGVITGLINFLSG